MYHVSKDAPAVEGKYCQVFEDHALGDIDADGLGGYAEERHSSPVPHASKGRVNGSLRAAHFEHDVDSEALVRLDQPVGHAVIPVPSDRSIVDLVRSEGLCKR